MTNAMSDCPKAIKVLAGHGILQRGVRLKFRQFGRWNIDFRTGLRVATFLGGTLSNRKGTKANQAHFIT